VRLYLEKTLNKKGLEEWLKVMALRSSPSTDKKKKKGKEIGCDAMVIVHNNTHTHTHTNPLKEVRRKEVRPTSPFLNSKEHSMGRDVYCWRNNRKLILDLRLKSSPMLP
jgi:hypothetical protein